MGLTKKQIYEFALVFVLDKLQDAEESLRYLPNNKHTKARYDKWLERRNELYELIQKEAQAEKTEDEDGE